ncbi:alpha-glucosidase family protein [Pyruvatibacter sp.]|uniref:alpha-glucosidase family protein n=1 Tax=Pyruvatibacter sp. TaxID=1981328 RepID=UPI0032EADF2C
MAAWWQGAVVYQIYPRSYLDTDGDGIGDLEGIRRKLDYVASLGVDAVWLSPIYPSPNEDYGYDVADYMDVDAAMGGMAAFDRLLEEAHARGLKVILDQVLSHTSDQHPWFVESFASKDSAKSDWYVWAKARADGTPPNNWLAAFGGASWSWSPLRQQYYFHQFLRTQPKLNFHNPDVVDAVLDVLRFWLDKGVDGFRLDVANSFVHDATLADNTAVPMEDRGFGTWAHPPRHQHHDKDWNQPENVKIMERIRSLVDSYEDRLVFGEFAGDDKILGQYAGGDDRLHTAYTFTLLEAGSLERSVFDTYYSKIAGPVEDLFPCVTFSNHDVARPVTRWAKGRDKEQVAKLGMALLMCLRGTALMYQGEELGLDDIETTREQVRDPFGKLYFPYFKGRDGCRSPMPWQPDQLFAGFSAVEPWLPLGPDHAARSVAAQQARTSSVLAFSKQVIGLRKERAALRLGDITLLETNDDVLAFTRTLDGQSIVCVFNFSDEPASVDTNQQAAPLLTLGDAEYDSGKITVGPLGVFVGT